jgi:FkbM family methyltransferase
MINPWHFAKNLVHSWRTCPTSSDCLSRLRWLYSDKLVPGTLALHRRISFCYAPPIGDFSVYVRDNHGSDAFVFSEVFDHRYYELDLAMSPCTILDLGANIGFTALFFARTYPHAEIACVEPVGGNVELLRENLLLNGVQARIVHAAISVYNGQMQITTDTHDYGHKVTGIPFGRAVSGPTINVKAISVCTLLEQLGWERIGLLKVDIEGYEGVLLKEQCEWLARVEVMCIECHEGYGVRDLTELASSYGFQPPRQLSGTWLLVRNNRRRC